MEKENLEEAAERFIPDNYIKVAPKQKVNAAEITRHYFREGAKWQAERMYSEEDLKQFGLYLGDNFKKLKGKTIDEIFEQFKKK